MNVNREVYLELWSLVAFKSLWKKPPAKRASERDRERMCVCVCDELHHIEWKNCSRGPSTHCWSPLDFFSWSSPLFLPLLLFCVSTVRRSIKSEPFLQLAWRGFASILTSSSGALGDIDCKMSALCVWWNAGEALTRTRECWCVQGSHYGSYGSV